MSQAQSSNLQPCGRHWMLSKGGMHCAPSCKPNPPPQPVHPPWLQSPEQPDCCDAYSTADMSRCILSSAGPPAQPVSTHHGFESLDQPRARGPHASHDALPLRLRQAIKQVRPQLRAGVIRRAGHLRGQSEERESWRQRRLMTLQGSRTPSCDRSVLDTGWHAA